MGEMCGKLYMLKVIPGKEYINVAKEESDMHLWHCRFGHLGIDDVSKLANNNMVNGMNDVGDDGVSPCESCIMENNIEQPTQRGHLTEQLNHSKLCTATCVVLCMSNRLEIHDIW
jgi:hypothetical protein